MNIAKYPRSLGTRNVLEANVSVVQYQISRVSPAHLEQLESTLRTKLGPSNLGPAEAVACLTRIADSLPPMCSTYVIIICQILMQQQQIEFAIANHGNFSFSLFLIYPDMCIRLLSGTYIQNAR